MKSKDRFLLWFALAALVLPVLNPSLVRASTIVTEEPGNTVVSDPTDDQLLRKCNTSFPDRPCSLDPTVSGPPFDDRAYARSVDA